MEQTNNNNKMDKVFKILYFVVQLVPLIIRFLSHIGGKPSTPPEDPTPDTNKDPAGTDFPNPN